MDTKERVITLIQKGYSAARAGEVCGIPRRTASNWWKKYQERGYWTRKPGSGGRWVSTPEQDQALLNAAKQSPFNPSKTLVKNTNFPGSAWTARRRLKTLGSAVNKETPTREILTDSQRVDRIAFCEEYFDYPWYNTVFSGEKVFVNTSSGAVRANRPKRSLGSSEKHASQLQYTRGRAIPVWGWISSRGGMLYRVEEDVTTRQYISILEDIMLPSARLLFDESAPIRFQQDLNGVFSQDSVYEWFSQHEKDIELAPWVPKGFDLNPIEDVWTQMQEMINRFVAQGRPIRNDQLWDTIETAWGNITGSQEYLDQLIESIPTRMSIVTNNGGYWSD